MKIDEVARDLATSLPAPRRTHDDARPLRVALITNSYNYIQDGVALTLNRLVAYLEARGVEVLVFAPVLKTSAFACHGEIVPVPSAPMPLRSDYRLSLGFPRACRERLRRFQPDIVHIAVPDLLGHQAQAFGLSLGVPVVSSYHTRFETYLKYYGLDFLREPVARGLRKFFAACDEVYVPSLSMAEELQAQGAAPNVHLWMRGVDRQRFNPAKRSQEWRLAHGIAADEVVVAFVGRLVREKRLATVVDALERMKATGVRHRGLIVGDGPDRSALEKALPDAVFTGFLAGEDLPTAYASADVFMFPSDTETFGNVTLEAMASGLPTICADATGSRSLVEPGVTGYLADAARGDLFFAHAHALASDGALRRRMGAAAHQRSASFSWDETMANLLARYETLCAKAAAPDELSAAA